MNQASDYVSAESACQLLGVQRQTLYAYVSRGWLRSVPGAGRKRLYSRADLNRLRARHDARRGHAAVAADALNWGEPVLESSISAIDAGGPRYRGTLAVELAERGAPFEAVCDLLWGAPEGEWTVAPTAGVDPRQLAPLLHGESRPLALLTLGLPALALADDSRYLSGESAEFSRARLLIRRASALLGLARGTAAVERALEGRSVAASTLLALGAADTKQNRRLADAALVLCADHELNISAFAARVVASGGADLYAILIAALAALTGSRHGGMCDRVEALVSEVGLPQRALAIVSERARRGEAIPGFSHPLYPDGDPRARPLLVMAQAAGGKRLKVLVAIIDAMREAGGQLPTIDTALVAVSLALGLPAGSAAGLFALGRMAGWVAHGLEQRESGQLLRPRARYVGP